MTRKSDRESGELKVNARLAALEHQVAILRDALRLLGVEVADIHYVKAVSRQQATDQDPEWYG